MDILPRIRELDAFVAEFGDARGTVRESHPEVRFEALATESMPPTSTPEGLDRRIGVLAAYDATVREAYEAFEATFLGDVPGHAYRFNTHHRDDVVDAMALSVTAQLADGDFETLPDAPEIDPRRGWPMKIVYAEPPDAAGLVRASG